MAKDNGKNGKETGEVGPGHPPVEHQFKTGHSGGPGRPKSRPIAAELKKLADKNGGEAMQALARVCFKKALKGDYRFMKELMERIDGKVASALDLTSVGEKLNFVDPVMAARVEAANMALEEAGAEDE